MIPRATALRALLFDLDGTLLDTAPDMVAALNALRAEERLPPIDYAHARRFVSHGSQALIALGFEHAVDTEFEALRLRFLDLYRARLAVETRLFAGLDRVLDLLAARSIPWAVVTNKPAWLTEPLLAALGLDQHVGCVVSGDTFPEKKPHPRPLLHAAHVVGAPPSACVFVGDAERDVIAARAAGMGAIVANFGYFAPHDDPRSWDADLWIDTADDLLAWLSA